MAVTVKAKDIRALVFTKGPGDVSASSGDSEDSTAATTWQDSDTEITIVPNSSRDYLIIATAELNRDVIVNSGEVRLQNITDTVTYNSRKLRATTTGDCRPWQCVVKVTLSAATTYKIQFQSITSGTTKLNWKSIVAIDLNDFPNVYYDEDRANSTTVSTSFVDTGNTLTETTNAGEHILFAGLHARGAIGANHHGEIKLTEDGNDLGTMLYRTQDRINDAWVYFCCYKVTLTVASHTFKFEFRKQGTGAGGLSTIDSAIALLELETTTIEEVPKDYPIPVHLLDRVDTNRTETIETVLVEVEILLDFDLPLVRPQILRDRNASKNIIVTTEISLLPWDVTAGTFYPSIGMPPPMAEPIIPTHVAVPLDELWATASPFNPFGIVEHHTKYRPPVGNKFGTKGQYIGTSEPISPVLSDLVYKTVTSAYTLTADDEVLYCNGTFTVTLPTAVGIGGKVYFIVNISTGIITVNGNGSETINDELTMELLQEDAGMIKSNNSNWRIL